MPRMKPNPQLIEDIVIRVPEGFISLSTLGERMKIHSKSRVSIQRAVEAGKVGHRNGLYFDPARLTPEEAAKLSAWCKPELPPIGPDGQATGPPIAQRRSERERRIAEMEHPAARALMERLARSDGYVEIREAQSAPDGRAALQTLIEAGMAQQLGDLIYDPLRLSKRTVRAVWERIQLIPQHSETLRWLKSQPGQVAEETALVERVGDARVWRQLRQMGGFITFEQTYRRGTPMQWVRAADGAAGEAEMVVRKALRAMKHQAAEEEDRVWERYVKLSGGLVRPGARDGKHHRDQVTARTYTPESAARRLGVRLPALQDAIRAGKLRPFHDPEGTDRIAAAQVEAAAEDDTLREEVAGYETLKTKEIAITTGVSYSTARQRLQRAGLSTTRPRWGDVRGRWNLPQTLREFRQQLKEKTAEWRAKRLELLRAAEERRHQRWLMQQEQDRQERETLRARLVAAFPSWRHEGRASQHITLHVGPTNSGKTYDALLHLAEVGAGWYLAPLRLLAFEVFDTLNTRGVLCNLLTGEERIDVPGAQITAATVEMFNPRRSGQCVLIDEAHLLADPDRGWAWTRAVMEAEAQEIHVIGAPTARNLVERLAKAAAVDIEVVEHQRLTPLRVAKEHWPLEELAPRTILVAFSRAGVLALKVFLEQRGRTASVVYGNLPPEVRRRQADRFARGETELCIATDAIGMGLNLPADRVCFAEIRKFDGREQRLLTPDEVRQIAGRAGRYLLSEYGEVGATTPQDLMLVRELFDEPPRDLSHARVAPTVEDIAMIPGHLAQRLERWAALGSIPETLRGAIQTADMTERIELASLLDPREVQALGLAAAMRLINAPTQQTTRGYWRQCASAILYSEAMPLPPAPPRRVNNHEDLEWAEMCIRCADIYLWLSSRREFAKHGAEVSEVRIARADWSRRIDEALVRKVDAAPRCANCGRRLPYNHRFRICDDCYRNRRTYRWEGYRDEGYDYDTAPFQGRSSRRRSAQPQDTCPVCEAEVEATPAGHLAHWKSEHSTKTELTAMRAAWLLGVAKSELAARVPYDYRSEETGANMRFWKLSTLEAAIDPQGAHGTA